MRVSATIAALVTGGCGPRSKPKHVLRKLGARSRGALLDGVVTLIERITAEGARGWIAHAGYRCA